MGIQRLQMRDGREIQGEPFSSLRNKVSYYQICKRTHLGFYKMATRLCFIAFLQKPRICNFKCLEVFSEKAMAPHSSTLAWKIPWMEEPGELQSMGSLRVGHDWETSLFTLMHWRRKWQLTPVFLLGESQGRGSLVGCRLWGRTELGTTEVS